MYVDLIKQYTYIDFNIIFIGLRKTVELICIYNYFIIRMIS